MALKLPQSAWFSAPNYSALPSIREAGRRSLASRYAWLCVLAKIPL